ncbi:MAG: YdcF family protein [Candidatus Peribacteraceae bacterium]|nr:YdcF family protein [Candidatus Peribacteraceae bacterium]
MKISHLKRFLKWLTAAIILVPLLVAGTLTLIVISHFDGTAHLEEQEGGGVAQNHSQGSGSRQVCGIVFGAAVHKGSLPGPGITRRVKTAARLYQEGLLQHIILTGGKGEPGVASEAEVMRDVALDGGIAAGDLTLENKARSTWENLLYSRPLTGSCTTVIGISDRYHLARITYLASQQGWEDIRTLPSDWDSTWPFEMKSIGREVVALLYYMIITHLFPFDEIAQHGIPDEVEPDVLGFMITKSDHLVCQLIC